MAFDYIELGRDQDARIEAAEVKRMNPNFAHADVTRDQVFNRRFENDLHKAGLN